MKFFFILILGFNIFIYSELLRVDGIITDNINQLEWQDKYINSDENINKINWTDSIEYCHSLLLSGENWRLPNINELESLLDDTQYEPSINQLFQKTNYEVSYWSSTTYIKDSESAWFINFNYGAQDYSNKEKEYYVRCVRDKE